MRNVEIKAKIRNVLKLMDAVNNLKPAKSEIINQHDTFYNVSHGRLKLRNFTDDKGELIFYERPDQEGPKISLYEKTAISGCKDIHRVLDKALGSKQIVKKTRKVFIIGQTRVHVDEVENLGNFVELEVVLKDDQSLEEGEQIANELMDKLGIDKSDLISGAYADLLVN